MFDIISIGDCVVDRYAMIDDNCPQTHLAKNKKLLCLNYGDKISIFEAGEAVGGNAANIAVGAQRLGLRSAVVTELGTDLNAEFILRQFKKEKVNTSLIRQEKRNKTRYSLVLNYRGERTILSYHSERKYSLPSLPDTQWIYYTSLGIGFEKIQEKLIRYISKHPNTKLAVNPGSFQINKGMDHFKKILKFTEVLFLNKEEAEKIVGKKLPFKKLFSSLHALGAKIVVLTDGANGSYASNGSESYFLTTYGIKSISKTGAGDAYAGAFLSALFYGLPLTEAMKWGTAESSSVIQYIGAQTGLCSKKQLLGLFKKFKQIHPTVLNT